MTTARHRHPVSELDPFSAEFLSNPHLFHEQLREAGPVVWLERYGIWAIARHEEVHAVLGDWETFCSSAGVGLSDFRKEKPWRPPSILLEADPPLHTRARAAIIPPPRIESGAGPHPPPQAGEGTQRSIVTLFTRSVRSRPPSR